MDFSFMELLQTAIPPQLVKNKNSYEIKAMTYKKFHSFLFLWM